MPIFLQYLYVIGIFQGVLLSGLLAFGKNNTNANRTLGLWCLFLALYFSGPFIIINQKLNIFSSLIGWSYFLPASFGAFLYLYCRNAIVEQKVTFSDLWLFLPFITCLLLNIDILTATAEVKLKIILAGVPQTENFIASEIVQALQALVFVCLSYQLINKYRSKAENTLSNFNPAIFNWLLKLIILFFTIWSLKLTGAVFENLSKLSVLADMLIVFMIYSIAMAQWRNPKLFAIEQLSNNEEDALADIGSHTLPTKQRRAVQKVQPQKTSALNESIRLNLLTSITKRMEEEQLFLDSQLTLTRLSEALGITTHHLSEVLNQQVGKNFYQFVNEYRINYFCQQLSLNHSLKLLDLALDAGFSSKSTFNSVFKQIKGVTPSQYRQTLFS